MIRSITLITGSSKGIGKQIGADLLKKGHNVLFTASTQKSLTELQLCFSQYPSNQVYICPPFNLSNLKETNDFIFYIKTNFSHIDNLILNVGKTCRKPFNQISFSDWNDVFNTNLTYPFFIIQQLKNLIKERIIFIGSVSGHTTDSSSIPYGVSKGSLEILTKYLAKEFAPNITVNTIAPGYICTDWHMDKPKEQIQRINKKILLKRFGTTKEISNACQFIIENKYINGQTLCIDGGFNFD